MAGMTVLRRISAWTATGGDRRRGPIGRAVARFLERVRPAPRPSSGAIDPTLPATAQVVAVQHPSLSLPERPYDLVLLFAVLGLLAIGTIEIYSATAAYGLALGNSAHFLERQIAYVMVGGFAMWAASRIDYRTLRQWVYPLLLLALVLLAATLATPPRNGARRWIPMGPLTFQPAEIAKLALVTYLAYSLGRKADQVKTFTVGFVPHLVVCGAMMVLLLAQPDLGSSIVLGLTTLGMLFMAGTRVSYILLAVLAAAPVGYHFIVGTPWRLQRVLAFFNPDAYASDQAYQFVQARLAMGSGGFAGVGLGNGHQTLGYMPEAHNDFILAPIGEELGWLGVGFVMLMFGILVWRGIRAALGARDVFGGYLAFGITLLFGVQVLFNMGVVLGIVPNKGITLPLVSYGGTGGHLFPGVAVAEELRARMPDAQVRFVGTRRGIEARVLPELGWELDLIEVSGLKTVGALGALRGLFRLPRALWQARKVVKAFAPDAVIGVGGYASGPVVLMARLAGIPTAICEQNSIPGLTNKILGRVVRAVFLSFEESRRFFKPKKVVMSGNPVRRDLVQKLLAAPTAAAAPHDKLHVLVCGGSLGAVAVNDLAAQALIALAKDLPLAIVHQTGEKGLADTEARYAAAGVPAECRAFIKDMAVAYQRADVIIGRAGATTVAELAIAGKPAIFIPYPFAADNHQEINAREMADAGAALMFRQAELTADKLAAALRPLLVEPDTRAKMGAAMKALAKPAAAATVVDWATSPR